MCELALNIYVIFVIAQIILFVSVGIWLFATKGPRKSFDQQIKEMSEDGLKTYRR